jgi:hypothetical protein
MLILLVTRHALSQTQNGALAAKACVPELELVLIAYSPGRPLLICLAARE